MSFQQLIALGLLVVSFLYLAGRLFRRYHNKDREDNNCGPNCNCT